MISTSGLSFFHLHSHMSTGTGEVLAFLLLISLQWCLQQAALSLVSEFWQCMLMSYSAGWSWYALRKKNLVNMHPNVNIKVCLWAESFQQTSISTFHLWFWSVCLVSLFWVILCWPPAFWWGHLHCLTSGPKVSVSLWQESEFLLWFPPCHLCRVLKSGSNVSLADVYVFIFWYRGQNHRF